jgi:virginiamycin B lyase
MIPARGLALPVALIAILAACGGGGGGGSTVPVAPTPSAPQQTPATTQAVTFSLSIPLPASTPASRRRNFTSSATNGAVISVTSSAGGSATATVDLSPSSNACTTAGTTRTCTVKMTVPIGKDTFTIATYDTAPVNGAIPATAHELGIGSTIVTVTTSSSPVTISISGLIANLGVLPAFLSLPADGNVHQVPVVLAPTDFGDQPIVAGSADPYANPISLTLTESGGTGHAVLIFDGVASGTSATLTRSSDTVSVQYDGGGAPGYSIGLTVGATGVTSTSTTISPLFASATGLVANVLTLTTAGAPVTVTISEANAPATQQYSAGATSGCSGIATATSATGGGTSATFTVTGSATPSLDQCSITISDGTSVVHLAITNAPGGVTPSPTPTMVPTATPTSVPTATPSPATGTGPVTINGYTLTTQSLSMGGALPTQIVAGPDGNMWFGANGNGYFGYTNASGPPSIEFMSQGGAALPSLTVGSDGNVWFADSSDGLILAWRPSTGVEGTYNAPIAITPTNIVGAPDGNLYFADTANSAVWSLTVGGQFTEFVGTSASYIWMTAGPDNALYLVGNTGAGVLWRFDLSTHAFTSYTPTYPATSIATGSDGNLWFTTTGNHIGRVGPAFASPAYYAAGSTSGGGQGIAAGADNAMWYALPGSNAVGRISVTSPATAPTLYSTAGIVPWDVALGHDGSIWYVDQTNSTVGHLVP